MKYVTLLFCAIVMALSTGAASAGSYRDTSRPLHVVGALDLERYMGRWHEIARFPISFEKDCIGVTADYTLRQDGKVQVVNTCVKATTGKVRQARGLAIPAGPGTLKVSFIPVFRLFSLIDPNYYVLDISNDYSLAVVGLPGGNAGWILSRTPQITQAQLDHALGVLNKNGYDTRQIRLVPQLKE